MYEDKTLVCKECGQEFVFTAGEQEFYARPRCPSSPSPIVLFTAATASPACAASSTNLQPKGRPCWGGLFLSSRCPRPGPVHRMVWTGLPSRPIL